MGFKKILHETNFSLIIRQEDIDYEPVHGCPSTVIISGAAVALGNFKVGRYFSL
jgi:hypothetical protein